MRPVATANRDLEPWLLPIGIFWVWFVTNRTGQWGVDIWMYLSVGKEVLQHGIPSKLVFTFGDAAQMPYFAYEWFSSVVFYTVERVGGMIGLEVMRYGLALILFMSLYRLYASITDNRASALFIAGIVIGLASLRLILRAELFGYICFVATLWCFVRFQASGRVRYLLYALPIMLLWVNAHGSYLLGFLLPPLFWASAVFAIWRQASFRIGGVDRDEILRASRPYLLVWLGILACGLCNPYGIRLWEHSLQLSLDPYIRRMVSEWHPTLSRLGDPSLNFYFPMVLLVALATLASFRRLSFHSWLLLAAFGYLSLSAVRHIYLFMFVGGTILAEAVRGRFDARRWHWGLHGVSLAAVLLIAGPVFIEAGNPMDVFTKKAQQRRRLSQKSIRFIDESGMQGPVINEYRFGNYLVYRFHPRIAVSMDSRIDAYGRDLVERNWAATSGSPNVFPDPPKHMIVSSERAKVLSKTGFLRKNPDWRMIYQDRWATIYSRDRSLWPDP
jgi:hypothetical protein